MRERAHIPEAVKARNALNAFIRDVAPALRERLEQGFTRKADNSLFKKDKDALRAIIQDAEDRHGNSRIRAYIDDKYKHGVHLDADINFPTGDHGCEYIKESIYLWSNNPAVDDQLVNLDHLIDVTESSMRSFFDELDQVEREINHLKSRQAYLKRALNQ